MQRRTPQEQRIDLCTKAYQAGLVLPEFTTWWPALGPLTLDERKLVRAAVKKVIEKSKIEVRT